MICCAFTERHCQVAIERTFEFTVYNQSINAEVIYSAGLFNCACLYSSSEHHSFFMYYSRLHSLLILGIISLKHNLLGDMVCIY